MTAAAARAIARAETLVFSAGAGMGVDSGLPDFRGNAGFWRAYPPLAKLGVGFEAMANPRWFARDPELAWGFYGHRRNLYRATRPHAGFALLLRWAERAPRGAFVFTSNVDAQFQRAGFAPAKVYECHGALELEQCTQGCGVGLFSAGEASVEVDELTLRARAPLPSCPRCGALSRPNVLMFGDASWDSTASDAQAERLASFLAERDLERLVVIECGAGAAIPTVRRFGERLAAGGATLVRINPRDHEVPRAQIAVPLGALAGLSAIAAELGESP